MSDGILCGDKYGIFSTDKRRNKYFFVETMKYFPQTREEINIFLDRNINKKIEYFQRTRGKRNILFSEEEKNIFCGQEGREIFF